MTPKTIDTSSKALLNFARQYFAAAEVVFNKERSLSRPLNHLYFHTAELLLKSFLRAHGCTPNRNHEIHQLYEKATRLGLKIPGDDIYGLHNVVSLLEKGNTDQAFRYGTLKGTSEPTLDWTREVIAKLLADVEAFVDFNPSATPGEAVKLTILFGKPVANS
jgi:HEPN domain-containing protein